MPRLTPITRPEGLSGAQREIYERIASGARGGVRGPHTVLLHNPELAAEVESLGRYARFECSVPQRLRELAILAISVHWRSRYEWYAHSPIAREHGIDDAVQAAIAEGRTPSFDEEGDRIVFDYVNRLLRDGRVDDETHGSAEALLSPHGVLDLVSFIGYYTLLAFVLNAFELEPPEEGGVPW